MPPTVVYQGILHRWQAPLDAKGKLVPSNLPVNRPQHREVAAAEGNDTVDRWFELEFPVATAFPPPDLSLPVWADRVRAVRPKKRFQLRTSCRCCFASRPKGATHELTIIEQGHLASGGNQACSSAFQVSD